MLVPLQNPFRSYLQHENVDSWKLKDAITSFEQKPALKSPLNTTCESMCFFVLNSGLFPPSQFTPAFLLITSCLSGECNHPLQPGLCSEHDSDPYCNSCYGRKFGPKGYGFAGGAGTLLASEPQSSVKHKRSVSKKRHFTLNFFSKKKSHFLVAHKQANDGSEKSNGISWEAINNFFCLPVNTNFSKVGSTQCNASQAFVRVLY